MCYSKEVQLATGVTISAVSVLYYFFYSIKYHALEKKWLRPFLQYIILAFICIGGHQIFEFLSLVTHNQIIYKIGLIISLSSMYFLIRSLEVILNRNLHSKIALLMIGLVTVHAFLIEMSFGSNSFYVRHNSTFVWASIWMLLFIYFHLCAFKGCQFLNDDNSKKSVLIYLLATIDISFILSVLYTLIGYWKFSVNVCTDSPSIWCTFFVIQIFSLPFFLSTIPRILEVPKKKTTQTLKETLLYFIVSLAILLALISMLPFFECLSLKFVFP